MKKPIAIYFTDEEYQRVAKVTVESIVKESQILELMIAKGIDTVHAKDGKGGFVFTFKNKAKSKEGRVTKIINIDERLYDELLHICDCTSFTLSYVARYLIMPQIDTAIKEGGWNLKL